MADPRGVVLVVVSALGFGFMALFKSWADPPAAASGAAGAADASGPAHTETILALRFTIAAVALTVLAAARGLSPPRGRDLGVLVFMGGVLYFGEAACYFFAIDAGAPSGLVALLLYLYPGMVAVLAWALLGERPGRALIGAIALGLVGSALTVGVIGSTGGAQGGGSAATTPILGIVLGVGTAVVYAVYILVGARLNPAIPRVWAAAVVTGSTAVSFWCVALWRGVAWPEGALAWTGVGLLALVSTVISITALLAGLARIGAVRASTLSVIEPGTTVIVGWLLLAEPMTPIKALGAALVLSAAVIAARSR